jgi:hypothetical protein
MESNKLNLFSLNVKNYKTNHVFLKQKMDELRIDICYLSELWLHNGEINLILEDFWQYNIFMQSDMNETYTTKKGRPYGG